MKKKTGAQLLVETLINHNVKYVFTVPGAKIDKTLDTFNDIKNAPKLIVTRHEQNAAFIAQGIGRLSEEPGVVLVTSGPGVSNLATGLVTATNENDPLLAIGGNVPRKDSLKRTHQSMDNVGMMKPITKYADSILSADAISEGITNAYKITQNSRKGAAFLSIPSDVQLEETDSYSLKPIVHDTLGHADTTKIANLADLISKSKLPVVLLGMRANQYRPTTEIRKFLEKLKLPVVQTFQAAGIITRELEKDLFFGRVGLFKNQPGDKLLDKADLVISIGFDPIEYDTEIWNKGSDKIIYHIDDTIAEIDNNYIPNTELIGDIARTVRKLTDILIPFEIDKTNLNFLHNLKNEMNNFSKEYIQRKNVIHPLHFMQTLRRIMDDQTYKTIDDDTVISVDVGSIYIWMARAFRVYQPKKLLFSNGMQTLGVALPWGMASSLLNPNKKMISMSGDGGFLFSGQELDTAVRLGLNLTHFIWDDNTYDMVKFQEVNKYGRSTAVDLGHIDFVKYAESFGAKGFFINDPNELEKVMKEALDYQGVVIVHIRIDYADNAKLGQILVDPAMQ